MILYFILLHSNILYRIRDPLAVEEIPQSFAKFCIFYEDGPALAIELMIHDGLDLISLSRCFDLVQGRLLDHVQSFYVVLLEH